LAGRKLVETGSIRAFEPGADEASSRFRLPERLYGRETEVEALNRALARARAGSPTLVALIGPPGGGKTALAHGLLPAVASARGYFSGGKFEQLRQPRAYSALVDALRRLLRQLLAQTPREVNTLKHRMGASLGSRGRVLTPILPELEVLLGSQEPARTLNPKEAKERFRSAVGALFRALCAHEYPVVLFLDDVQWADRGSVELARDLLGQTGLRILIVMAYRDGELPAEHAIRDLPAELAPGAYFPVEVEPMSVDHVAALLADTLRQPATSLRGLARLAVTKTSGNAYFVREFLSALHAAGGIAWSRPAQRWTWSEDMIAELPMADNVAALLSQRLSVLSPEVQHVLSVAACVGGRFDLQLLAEGLNLQLREIASACLAALDAGLLRPIGDALDELHTIMLREVWGEAVDCTLQFTHDRVQQAAAALLEVERIPAVRLELARRLRERSSRTVEIVDQYNEALDLIDDPAERRTVAVLNLEAAVAATRAASFDTAHRYYRAGVQLLPNEIAGPELPLARNLLLGAADAALMVPGQPDHESLVDRLLSLAVTPEQRVAALDARLRWRLARYENAEALKTVFEALRHCGVTLP